eukprot:TRINITY_DN860_c0_g4_i1.p1 TRINITY_DN860_c0_g4~~TRINITY_DN860_c0_g4_i1.p1  ORF type:complete len:566 (+),score=160.60 TRINITY_DN860_c0_g4_i1:90-1787(+)
MGGQLPKAAEAIALERYDGKRFRAGLAELNGWRCAMEDAHSVVMKGQWAFFAVFDGHCGDQCAKFVARRIPEELAKTGLPKDDDTVTDMCLRLDREFLDETTFMAGTTATFAFVSCPQKPGGKFSIRVGNVGDSRVLLGKRDGTIVDGGGTDQGLTVDHKPDHPVERERIERVGGKVEYVMGVARVNGDLAVSRAFGDRGLKMTGDRLTSDHPVSARPDHGHFECDADDFLMLVCDGVSEGNFSNAEAVACAAAQLREHNDPALASAEVIKRALEMGSRDNISAMVVLMQGDPKAKVSPECKRAFIPGSLSGIENLGFRSAYEAMAQRAGLTMAEAVDRRYKEVKEELARLEQEIAAAASRAGVHADLESRRASLLAELRSLPDDLPGEPGSEERLQRIAEWLRSLGDDADGAESRARMEYLQRLQQEKARMHGARVQTPSALELHAAIDAHCVISWDDRIATIAEEIGDLLQEDASDGTSRVHFRESGIICWLPTSCLTRLPPEGPPLEDGEDEMEEAPEPEEQQGDGEARGKKKGKGSKGGGRASPPAKRKRGGGKGSEDAAT